MENIYKAEFYEEKSAEIYATNPNTAKEYLLEALLLYKAANDENGVLRCTNNYNILEAECLGD